MPLEQDDPVWSVIGPELGNSRYLLVLCSPGAVGSAWVSKEVGWFLEHRGAEWILPAVTDAADPGVNPAECFPALMIEAGIHQSIFYDLRALGPTAGAPKVRNCEDEMVRLASALLDWRADKHGPLSAIWEREQLKRRRRQAQVAIVVAAAVAAAAVIAVWQALAATRQARRARANAIVQTADASFDPLTAALLLAKLPREEEPEGGMNVAERLATTPLPRAVLRGHTGAVKKVAFSPDRRRVLTASADGTARVWSTDGSGKVVLLSGPEGHSRAVFNGAFSPDGTRVLTVSQDGTARIWHSDGSGRPLILRGADPGQEWLEQCAYSPTGETVVTTSEAGRVWVWRADGEGRPVVLRYIYDLAHNGPITSVAFSPDGRRIVTSGGLDLPVRVWQADGSGRPYNLVGHAGAVASASFSPDGSRVLSASEDGTARVWRTRWSDLVERLRGMTTATLTVDQRVTLLGETEQDARAAYEAAEREMARTPLPADWRFTYPGF